MYRALESFTTKDYDVRRKQLLEDNFTTQEEIEEFLRIGYIEVYDGTLEITENGQYNVEDYQLADVDVPSGEPTLQSKSVTITENGTSTISPDTGYDGLSGVEVTTNVSGGGGEYNAIVATSIGISSFSGLKLGCYIKKIAEPITLPPYNTDLNSFFHSCIMLEEVPEITNFSIVRGMRNLFYNCQKLKSIPEYNTRLVTDMRDFCSGCSALENVPLLNTGNLTDSNGGLSNAFYGCPNLSNESLNNILAMCANVPASYPSGKKSLSWIGLSSTQKATCQTLSNYQAFLDAGWSAS